METNIETEAYDVYKDLETDITLEKVVEYKREQKTKLETIFNEKFEYVQSQVALAYEVLSNPNQNYVLVSPTGSGKTEIAYLIAVARSRQNPGSKTLIIEPNQRLAEQTLERANKYGLEDHLVIRRNPVIRECVSWERSGKWSPYQRSRNRNTARRYQKMDSASCKERKILSKEREWKTEVFKERKYKAYNADIMISTVQLIKSDVYRMNERDLSPEMLRQFDTIIIDEVPDAVAYEYENAYSGEEDIHYRVSKLYSDLFSIVGDSAQIIGLTAFPGKKAESLEILLNAEMVKPERNLVDQFIPNGDCYEIKCKDEFLLELSQKLSLILGRRKSEFVSELENNDKYYGHRDLNFTILSKFARSKNKEIAKRALSIMKLSYVSQMILESSWRVFGSKLNYANEEVRLIDYLEKIGIDREWMVTELRKKKEGDDFDKIKQVVDLAEAFDKVVIATNYVEPARALREALRDRGIFCRLLTGSDEKTPKEQMEVIHYFNNATTNVLIMTYGAGGYGLDLWAGKVLIYLGMPSTLEKSVQMQGRITRQKNISEGKKMIYIHPLVYEGTIDKHFINNVDVPRYEDWPGREISFDEQMLENLMKFLMK